MLGILKFYYNRLNKKKKINGIPYEQKEYKLARINGILYINNILRFKVFSIKKPKIRK